ncbi:hypothetical protein [Flavihumibacter petaseus]|uniref:Uncharacterized protein n=1 Tax=Flavihumibacter petaseus NBRC 106054 TaxID=1220578 RepID=A0A0E9N5W2_9BACT|nr:hypothetical protein [Flavihumibacter petaseus]GAO45209.1 hypothetical protein FPE01S_04_04530 [Flavihumibacter petaseus NBRC 106054]
MFFTQLYSILYKLGKGLPLRETAAFFYTTTCLIFPIIGYENYTQDNLLARAFIKYMIVKDDVYFGTALPAIASFVTVLTWPLSGKNGVNDFGEGLNRIVYHIKSGETDKHRIGILIILIGTFMSIISKYLPGGLGFVAILFYFSSFAGLLYLYYSKPSGYKYTFITLFLIFILSNALATGMFTIVAYMGITLFSFFFLGNKTSMFRKLAVVAIGVIFIFVLQASKGSFRQITMNTGYQGNRAMLFAELFMENLGKGTDLLQDEEFFPLYVRMNQGWNISLVMNRIPAVQPHDNGKELMTVVAASVVPRLFWPDKPMAGGKFNMKHYAGMTITDFSTNVGPLGEGYGSFGRLGAVIFMGVLAWFVRWAYNRVFQIAANIPLLICWLPVLFYQLTYSAETDTLQILNSIVKGSFFIWLLYKFRPDWFGVPKQSGVKKVNDNKKLWYN